MKSHMKVNHEFKGVRVTNSQLVPVKWKVSVSIKHKNEADPKKAAVAYHVVKMWMEMALDSVLVLSNSEENVMLFDNQLNNQYIMLPEDSTDDVFVEALHSKISAICGEFIDIMQVSVAADDVCNEYYFSTNDADYTLPEDSVWLDSDSYAHRVPWWKRRDCDTSECCIPDDEEVDEVLSRIDTASILWDMYTGIDRALFGEVDDDDGDDGDGEEVLISEDVPEEEEKEAELVVVEWKPSIL